MDIRGIRFQIPNEYGQYLKNILQGIDLEQYIWEIDDEESYKYVEGEGLEPLFEQYIISGSELRNIVSLNICYIIFLRLSAYKKTLPYDEINTDAINTYEDFFESECQLMCVIVDNSWVDIYIKNEDELEIIKNNASNSKFKEIIYITEDNTYSPNIRGM